MENEKRRDRRGRRGSANLRHRARRHNNRRGKKGSLAPFLKTLVEGILNIAERFRKLAPLAGIRMERARFDSQARQNLQIHRIEYQRGDSQGLSGSGNICL